MEPSETSSTNQQPPDINDNSLPDVKERTIKILNLPDPYGRRRVRLFLENTAGVSILRDVIMDFQARTAVVIFNHSEDAKRLTEKGYVNLEGNDYIVSVPSEEDLSKAAEVDNEITAQEAEKAKAAAAKAAADAAATAAAARVAAAKLEDSDEENSDSDSDEDDESDFTSEEEKQGKAMGQKENIQDVKKVDARKSDEESFDGDSDEEPLVQQKPSKEVSQEKCKESKVVAPIATLDSDDDEYDDSDDSEGLEPIEEVSEEKCKESKETTGNS